jgi:hypothetical protein
MEKDRVAGSAKKIKGSRHITDAILFVAGIMIEII